MTISSAPALLRLAAFTTDPAGGNPAGVWIGDPLPAPDEMQRIAAEVGYSETAFLAPSATDPGAYRVRYFSPLAEVPFCGHATIASGVALAARGAPPTLALTTNDGVVTVDIAPGPDGPIATLTSVAAWAVDPPEGVVPLALELLAWDPDELDPMLPPAIGFAGARHLILAVRDRSTLSRMSYPFEPMQALMRRHDLTTLQLVWRAAADRFDARDPFAVGGVVEDPATGAAAAALGAYLRDRGVITAPATFQIRQGVEMGRPSCLTVSIVPGEPGVRVSGTAVPIQGGEPVAMAAPGRGRSALSRAAASEGPP